MGLGVCACAWGRWCGERGEFRWFSGVENQTLSAGLGDLMNNTFIRLNTICIHAPKVVHIQDEG